MTDNRPPHQWVAKRIGFSVAGVSLLRSGGRLPSFEAMITIAREFDWDVGKQTIARLTNCYAAEFERAITRAYNAEEKTP